MQVRDEEDGMRLTEGHTELIPEIRWSTL